MAVNKDDVQVHILNYLYSFTGIPADDFVSKEYLNNKLNDDPPGFDDTGLICLAQTLRGYIKNLNSTQTILSSDLSNLTISGLIDLVFTKINKN